VTGKPGVDPHAPIEATAAQPSFRWLRLAQPEPHVTIITMARPPVNALDSEIRAELIAAVDRLQEAESARAIVLAADGRVFCAGADLKEKQALSASSDRAAAARLTRELFLTVMSSSRPVVAAVGGAALGAGFVLAACCDLIVASEDAYFALPEIDVGQGGGASFLQRILPQQTMRAMMLTGERVSALELHRVGGIYRVVSPGQAERVATEIAAHIAAKNSAAVQAMRSSFEPVAALPARVGFALEQAYIDELSVSPAGRAARQAFLDRSRYRRSPGFRPGMPAEPEGRE
jgi:enoyl-CoA hydratase